MFKIPHIIKSPTRPISPNGKSNRGPFNHKRVCTDMDRIGVMLYGYDEKSAFTIKDHLRRTNEKDVILISGSGREGDLIGNILEGEKENTFQNIEDPKVVMFLGFEGPVIHSTMDNFPKIEGQKRPIFCTPTENNMGWTLKDLLEDLTEEREYFKKKDKEMREEKDQ